MVWAVEDAAEAVHGEYRSEQVAAVARLLAEDAHLQETVAALRQRHHHLVCLDSDVVWSTVR